MNSRRNLVLVVDDDASVRKALERLLRSADYDVRMYSSAEEFLADASPSVPACAILDLTMPGLNGLQLQSRLADDRTECGIVFLTGHGDMESAVQAMKHGAVDFLSKPIDETRLLAAVDKSLESQQRRLEASATASDAKRRFQPLTAREREVMELVIAGRLNKVIAAKLDISEKTVKAHRGNVMRKTGAGSVAELVQLYIAARGTRNS